MIEINTEWQPFASLLTEWAQHRAPRERAAVAALVADRALLDRDGIRTALIAKQDGRMACDWARLTRRRVLVPDLAPSDHAFLTLVIAIAFPRLVALWKAEALDRRRLAIILRAVEHLAATSTVEEPT